MFSLRDVVEAHVKAKIERKFDKLEAKAEESKRQRQEVKSWAQIADRAETRRKIYQERREWVWSVVNAGLLDHDEALKLAKIKFKL